MDRCILHSLRPISLATNNVCNIGTILRTYEKHFQYDFDPHANAAGLCVSFSQIVALRNGPGICARFADKVLKQQTDPLGQCHCPCHCLKTLWLFVLDRENVTATSKRKSKLSSAVVGANNLQRRVATNPHATRAPAGSALGTRTRTGMTSSRLSSLFSCHYQSSGLILCCTTQNAPLSKRKSLLLYLCTLRDQVCNSRLPLR